MRSRWAVILLVAAVLLLPACDLVSDSGEAGEDTEPTATADLASLTPIAVDDLNVTSVATPAPTSNTLRLWLPPPIAERTEAGATTLSDQIFAFDTRNEDITLVVERKRVRGSGGIVNYLRTGRGVAPSILPDLVAIPTDLLPVLFTDGLIQPIGDRLDGEALEALYPAALSLGQPEDTLLGYPFALGSLPHLVFNNNALTGTLPLTWDRLMENDEYSYLFAADGADGALLALQFYFDSGGQLVVESGQTTLELEPLVTALRYIEDGRDSGLFAAPSSTLSSTDQAWQSFLGGGGNIVQTSADHYLAQSVDGLPIAYTIIPGIDRPLTPLVDGWAWAITTTDPAKQELAVSLIRDLTDPQNLAAWSEDSAILPARRDGLELWSEEEPYTGFIGQELERAQPLTLSVTGKLFTVLSDAVFQVVSGTKSAQEAATGAISAMQN